MLSSFIKSFSHVVKKWEFQTAKFHLKTESSEIGWKLKRNLQSKNWEVEKIIVFQILETQCHLLKLRKKWSKSNELCLQKKDKTWYWPSFNFKTETKTFNKVKVLTEASDLIARWKILSILSSNANDTKVAINWKNCVYNAVEKVPDARPHFEKENPLTK